MVHLFTQTIISTSYNKTISNFCFSVAQAVELLNLLAGVILSLTFVRFGLALMTHYRPVKFVTDKWKFRAMTAIITSNNKKNTILPWLWLNAILLCNKISAQFFVLILIVTYFFLFVIAVIWLVALKLLPILIELGPLVHLFVDVPMKCVFFTVLFALGKKCHNNYQFVIGLSNVFTFLLCSHSVVLLARRVQLLPPAETRNGRLCFRDGSTRKEGEEEAVRYFDRENRDYQTRHVISWIKKVKNI